MKLSITRSPILSLLWNLLVVYVMFMVCRVIFVLANWTIYSGTLTWGHTLELFGAGLIFDTSAILYTNALVSVMMLFPLHWKEKQGYYKIVRWIYVICNSVAIYANLIDCVYFPFTGKRTTTSVFAEFSHEGAGNMAKIFAEQFLANWYLVVVAALISWLLWKLFRPVPSKVSSFSTRLPVYYITQVVVMLLAIPLFVAGMRGGFTTAVRPITISNANQYADRPAETGIILNTPFSIYRTLSKKPMLVPDYMSEQEATALFKPMNVVVFILESFSKQHFGYYNRTLRNGTYKGFTPFLDSLITNHALTWQYSYANGRKSIEGMPSTLSSLPNYVEPLFLTPASLNRMSGIARELGEQKGYVTAFFHGAQNNSMGFQAFAHATGFQRYYGRTEYNQDPKRNGDEDFDGTWAIFDEEFLQFFADRMTEMQQPFMTAVFTASSHTPYSMPERYKNVFPKGEEALQENTLFVITADHTSRQIDPFYKTSLGYYTVPIILYAPGDESLHGYDTERVVEQTDIMPTVLSYLHYDKPYIAFGKDMLHTQPEETFALHWVPESNGYEFVKGDYVIEFDGEQVTAAYRYRTDSLLNHNVKTTMPAGTLQQMTLQAKSVIQQYMQRMNNDQLTAPK